jgi:hypothetical protein
MIATLLLMFVGGIGLTQAVSDPKQVTLRWLRLGGLVSVALLAAGGTMTVLTGTSLQAAFWITSFAVVAQLMLTQVGRGGAQRIAAAIVFLSTVPAFEPVAIASNYAAAGLLGGFLMAMLLGHAYLTAGGEMTQQPLRRLVKLLAVLLLARAALSGIFGALPYFQQDLSNARPQTWNVMMITARYLVGIVVPAVFTYMIDDCVKRRANQSATGILYVAGVLVIMGEGAALALRNATGFIW